MSVFAGGVAQMEFNWVFTGAVGGKGMLGG